MSRHGQALHITVPLSPDYMERLTLLAKIAHCDPRNYCRQIIEGWIQEHRPKMAAQLQADLKAHLIRFRESKGGHRETDRTPTQELRALCGERD